MGGGGRENGKRAAGSFGNQNVGSFSDMHTFGIGASLMACRKIGLLCCKKSSLAFPAYSQANSQLSLWLVATYRLLWGREKERNLVFCLPTITAHLGHQKCFCSQTLHKLRDQSYSTINKRKKNKLAHLPSSNFLLPNYQLVLNSGRIQARATAIIWPDRSRVQPDVLYNVHL